MVRGGTGRGARRPAASALLVALAVLLAFGAPAGAHDVGADLEETRAQLEAARGALAMVDAEVAVAQAALSDVDQRFTSAAGTLDALEVNLALARVGYEAATARTQRLSTKLAAELDRLSVARGELAEHETNIDQQAANAYKRGGSLSLATVLLEADDFHELMNSAQYVRSVIDHEQQVVDDVDRLVRAIDRRRERIESLRARSRAREREAAALRDQLDQLTLQQRDATVAVQHELEHHEAIVGELESSRSQYDALVTQLEAESAALEEQLRESRWRAGAPGAGELVWPTDGGAGSGFGYRTHPIFGTQRLHSGVDISGGTGQTIVAAGEGFVVSAGWRGGYGLCTVIDHGGGVATLYAHQSALSVSAGEVVASGEKIGEVGSTGWSTGPHLHFEVRVNGEPRDPMAWF